MSSSDLTVGDLGVAMRRMAIPASTGFLFNILFNVEDTFYAGLLGTEAQGALAFSFVLFFVIIATGVGISHAAAGLVGRTLGQRKQRRARYYAAQFLVATAAGGLLLMVFGRTLLGPLLTFLGATGDEHALSLEYLVVIFDCSPILLATMALSGLLNAQGNTWSFRNALIAATVLNLALDPMLMFGWFGLPALGMYGIGLATVIAQALMVVWMLIVYMRTTPYLRGMKAIYLRPRPLALLAIFRQGLPQTLNMLGISAGFLVNTFFLARLGDTVIASYGIALRIEQLLLVLSIGINIGLLAIASQNFGATQYARVRAAVGLALRYGFAIALAGSAVMLTAGGFLLGLFNSDPEVGRIGYSYLITAAILAPAYVVIHTSSTFLQAIGKPAMIGPFGLLRLAVLPVIFNSILVTWLEYGVPGVWISLVSANYLVAAMLAAYSWRFLARLAGPGLRPA